jgi:hypothetical protein
MNRHQAAPPSEPAWADRYEGLRLYALGEPAATRSVSGLDVLLQHGVAVWMRTTPPGAGAAQTTAGPPCQWLATDPEATTLVLVEMALSQFGQPHRRN